jgi:cell wall-associated NlpC family hydrolase
MSASYTDMTRMTLRTLVMLLAVASSACAARGAVPRPFPGASLPPGTADVPPKGVDPSSGDPATRETGVLEAVGGLVGTALELLGAPYRLGGSNPSGFDCSGFVQWVFGRHGMTLPREVRDQYASGRSVELVDVQQGDLLFFETVARGPSHVGIALGNGRFVHAPSSKGVVRVEPYTASYWARRFVGVRRIGEKAEAEHVEEVEEVNVKEVVRPRVFPGSIQSAR